MLLFLIMAANLSHAEDNQSYVVLEKQETLGLIKNVYLTVNDMGKNNCWTNAEKIRQNTRLKLEQSGISVIKNPLGSEINHSSVNLLIAGMAIRTENGVCVGSLTVDSYKKSYERYDNLFLEYQSSNFHMSSLAYSSSNLNNQFEDYSDQFVSQFAADILSYRRNSVVKNAQLKLKEFK